MSDRNPLPSLSRQEGGQHYKKLPIQPVECKEFEQENLPG